MKKPTFYHWENTRGFNLPSGLWTKSRKILDLIKDVFFLLSSAKNCYHMGCVTNVGYSACSYLRSDFGFFLGYQSKSYFQTWNFFQVLLLWASCLPQVTSLETKGNWYWHRLALWCRCHACCQYLSICSAHRSACSSRDLLLPLRTLNSDEKGSINMGGAQHMAVISVS